MGIIRAKLGVNHAQDVPDALLCLPLSGVVLVVGREDLGDLPPAGLWEDLLAVALWVVREGVAVGTTLVQVEDEVVARVDLGLAPDVDEVDDLAVDEDGRDEVDGPGNGAVDNALVG
jgi:hypothetical protein